MKSAQINNVLITGVAGFIGSNLLDFLLEHTSWKITGVDNLSTGSKENISHRLEDPRFVFLEQRCKNISSLQGFDCIFHLAALPRIQPSFTLINEHIEANVLESTHLIELMIRENHFPRFVYSGSSAIYGTPKNVPTDEGQPISCLSPYAFQKYEVETYLDLIATRYPLDYITLRYFNPYGPRSFNPKNPFNAYGSVVGIFLDCLRQQKPLQVTGDGAQQRDFIHVMDVARANYAAALAPKKVNIAFNIGFGSTLSILDLAKRISDKYVFIAKREGEADITHADNNKAKEMLGWMPIYNLDEYIREYKSKMIKP